MTKMTTYPHGQFCWADLQTSDVDGAKKFYGALFGWDLRDTPVPNGPPYTMFFVRGESVAGGGPLSPDAKQHGVPPNWSCMVKVDDVDAACKKASAAGGQVLMPAMDVMSEGRMAVVADPTGAAFGVWQPKNHKGAGLWQENNTLCWFELLTDDVNKATRFYTDVFGWSFKGGPDYQEIVHGGASFGGIMQKPPMPMPSVWMPYFQVADIDAVAKKTKELGGKVVMGPQKAAEIGTFAVLSDPQGATFDVIQMATPK